MQVAKTPRQEYLSKSNKHSLVLRRGHERLDVGSNQIIHLAAMRCRELNFGMVHLVALDDDE